MTVSDAGFILQDFPANSVHSTEPAVTQNQSVIARFCGGSGLLAQRARIILDDRFTAARRRRAARIKAVAGSITECQAGASGRLVEAWPVRYQQRIPAHAVRQRDE
jgi:hypothetical protein